MCALGVHVRSFVSLFCPGSEGDERGKKEKQVVGLTSANVIFEEAADCRQQKYEETDEGTHHSQSSLF